MSLNKNIIKNLQNYYNHQAKKYSQTRRKFWSEKFLLKNVLSEYLTTYYVDTTSPKKKLRILEFGCGDGRFLREVLIDLVSEYEELYVEYVGVDISQGLLDIAEQDMKNVEINNQQFTTDFVCTDIVNYMKTCEQESFDIILGIASFQHIQIYDERLYLMQHFYKILNYDGILLMLNWSFSYWFIKKYWKAIITGIKRYFLSFGKKERNSLYLPWKSSNKTFQRFYHIFLLKEFRKLVLFSGFVIRDLAYVNKKGEIISDMKYAKNSFFVAQKTVLG